MTDTPDPVLAGLPWLLPTAHIAPGLGYFSVTYLTLAMADGRNSVGLAPWSFFRPNGERVDFRKGGASDGPSVPTLLWNVAPPDGPIWIAGVGHDDLYRRGERPKAECDTIFLEMAEATGTPRFKAIEFYEAVKLWGGAAFNDDRKNQGGITQ